MRHDLPSRERRRKTGATIDRPLSTSTVSMLAIVGFFGWVVSPLAAAAPVTIVIDGNAPALEKFAATELAAQLSALFQFETRISSSAPADGSPTLLVGNPQTNRAVAALGPDAWPNLSSQGHVLRTVHTGNEAKLVIGGGSPVATLWAVYELGYRFGIRHLLHGDFLPVERPVFTLKGFDIVMEPRLPVRAWSGFIDHPIGAESWPIRDHQRLLAQLAKLKFTHLIIPPALAPLPAIRVDGDTPGRKAFRGAREFANPDINNHLLDSIKAAADAVGIVIETQASALGDVVGIAPGSANAAVLPQFSLERVAAVIDTVRAGNRAGFVAQFVVPGDLGPSAHFLSRASFVDALTAPQALNDLVTPICGAGVAERLNKGFAAAAKAAALIAANDPAFAVADAAMVTRQLASSDPPPAWWSEARTLYTEAMNEMYRGNTRARDGARPMILYHAKRFEFALHYVTTIEAARKAGNAKAPGLANIRLEALEQAVEAMYNALSALADVARDSSDQGTIAVLNEYAYRPLLTALEQASGQ